MSPASDECANPLFRQWVGEWMEEARKMQNKSYYTYKKAYESLSRYPLELAHASEAVKLKGIGEGMAKRLEQRMIRHCQENGLPVPERPQQQQQQQQGGRKRRNASDDSESSSNKRQRSSSAAQRTYIPRYRSGAYAILLALLALRDQGFAAKEQIIRVAQDHCDASFDMPQPGKNCTAWSSIKTLLAKGYVWKQGSPPKYVLTDTGLAMAEQLKSTTEARPEPSASSSSQQQRRRNQQGRRADDESDSSSGEEEVDLSLYVFDPSKYGRTNNNNNNNNSDTQEQLLSKKPIPHDNEDVIDRSSSEEYHWGSASLNNDNNTSFHQQPFQYTYLNIRKRPTRHMSQAKIDIDDATSELLYHIQFSSQQATHPRAKAVRKLTFESDDVCTGYLPEDVADIVCPGLPLAPLEREEEEDDNFWPCSEASSQATATENKSHGLSEGYCEYPPDSYDIVMILDNREIKMKSNREYFQEQLAKREVLVTKRALDLGDVIWVARKKGSTISADELFLDVIVERKRMDDLVTSIKDGRFDEQKFRLQQSGARKIFYIVEEYSVEEASGRFGPQAVQTAMSSTQVIDGFYLKRTGSIDETIEYLVRLTRMIQRMFQGVTLYRIPEHIVSRQNYLEIRREHDRNHVISYPLFNHLNSKTSTLTVRDLYLRMLMTVRGVSAEKAAALMKRYPTPKALLEAYCSSNANSVVGKTLAHDATKDGISRRRWGNSLSEKLWCVWGQESYF